MGGRVKRQAGPAPLASRLSPGPGQPHGVFQDIEHAEFRQLDPMFPREEIEGVGFKSASYDEMAAKYDPTKLSYGYNTVDGEEIYFIPNPALGLWIDKERFNA